MKLLQIKENSPVKVSTKFGSVVVKAVKSMRSPHSRILFMPYGPWASLIMNPKTNGTGMPSLKGIPATVTSVPGERVLSVAEILTQFYRRGT